MADVASNLFSWSTTASSNSPSDATTIGAGLADNFQEIQKVVRQDLASKGADIASATTTDIGAVAGKQHDITGVTTITSFGTVAAGIEKVLQFDGALTLTHSGNLILPGAVNILTVAGDVGVFASEGSGVWRCISFVGKNVAGTNGVFSGTLAVTGVATLTAQPILSSLTASLPVFSDASKGLVSNAITGTGNVMMSASPTTTGTLTAAAITMSGDLQQNNATYVRGKTTGATSTRIFGITAGDSLFLGSVDAALSGGLTYVNNGVTQFTVNSAGTFAVNNAMTVGTTLGVTGVVTGSGGSSTVGAFYATGTVAGDVIGLKANNDSTTGVVTSSVVFTASGVVKGRIKSGVYGDGYMKFYTNTEQLALTLDSTQNAQFVGAVTVGTTLGVTGAITGLNATAIPAGGTAGSGLLVSSTANFGVFFGSGAPSLSAAKGSLYLRSDGSTTNDRMYVNTNGTTGWTAVTTAA